ncbi:MAG: restriction endonuclease subunit S [Spirochaetota bacterium]
MVNYFNSRWELRPLGECLEFISRGVPPKYVSKRDIAALNQKAIRWGFIEEKHLKYHDSNKKIKDDLFIRKGDIVVNSTGDITIGRAYYFKKGWPRLFADSHVTILRLNRNILLPEFCIYLFPTQEYQTKIYGLVTGTTGQLELSKNNLCKLEMIVPPLPIQQKIAAILSAYDDLIENNLRRIKILEEMAQNLYREWFVKFRFPACAEASAGRPGHEKVKMVSSLLGKIPEGWGVKRLGDICSILMGQSPKSEFYNTNGEGLPFHQGVTDFGERFPTTRVYCTFAGRIAETGDILCSVRAPVGRINLADHKIIIGRGLSAIRNLDGYQYFTFHQLKEIFKEEDIMGGGTIFKAVTKGDMERIECLYPPKEYLARFEKICLPIAEQLAVLSKKNCILRKTRDLLLPKLISGELDVSELDIAIPEANA